MINVYRNECSNLRLDAALLRFIYNWDRFGISKIIKKNERIDMCIGPKTKIFDQNKINFEIYDLRMISYVVIFNYIS